MVPAPSVKCQFNHHSNYKGFRFPHKIGTY
nr:MAG TPA: hypothetical protein [Caudoviricetes sp.]